MNKTFLPEASALENHIGFWLRFVSNQVSGRFESLLAAHDVKVTEWVALRVLYQRKHTTHAELIDALGMTKGAASKIVTKLESKGLAERSSVGWAHAVCAHADRCFIRWAKKRCPPYKA